MVEPPAGSLLCSVEDTPRWVGASGLHGTEWGTSGDLELACNEAVRSRGRGPGIHRLYINTSKYNNIAILIHSHIFVRALSSTAVRFCCPQFKDLAFLMRSHKNLWYARSKYPTQLAKMSFDEILDLTADAFLFYYTVRHGRSKNAQFVARHEISLTPCKNYSILFLSYLEAQKRSAVVAFFFRSGRCYV